MDEAEPRILYPHPCATCDKLSFKGDIKGRWEAENFFCGEGAEVQEKHWGDKKCPFYSPGYL